MLKQRTLKNSIKAVGIGLHTGKNINMELIPAEANSGINFIRTDIDKSLVIPAIAENVGDTSLSTALVKDGVKISTIKTTVKSPTVSKVRTSSANLFPCALLFNFSEA